MRLRLLRVRRLRSGVAVEIFAEPVELPVEAFHQVLGLAGARQIVIFTRKENEFRRNAIVLKRAEPLLALLDGNAIIVVGMKNESRRFDVARILERRSVPVLFEVVEEKTLEVIFVAVRAVARPVVADEIGDGTQRDGGLEAIGVTDDPVGHVAAIAASGDTKIVR